jgi:hypothetical protein
MGTSVNQSSPRTLRWSAAQAGYRSDQIPVPRVVTEVWRAALNQPTGDMAQLLSQPIVARLGVLASEAESAPSLSRDMARVLAETKKSTLGTEIARRAALQCIEARDRMSKYAERLLAEATAYLVCRDLPGFVGSGRTRTVADSMEFKKQIMNHVADVAGRARRPKTLTARSWARYVKRVMKLLQGEH